MPDKKHILILTPGFPCDEQDSVCIPAMQDFLSAFIKAYPQIKLTVVSLQYPAKKIFLWRNIEVHSIGGQNRSGLFKLLSWQMALNRIKQINSEHRIDLIHSFWMTEAAYIGQKAAKKLRLTHVVTVMGQDAVTDKYWGKIFPDKLVALSSYHAQKISDYHDRTAEIVPWGVRPFNTPNINRDIDVIGVGSLINVKNWMKFISIIEELNKSRTVSCKIIGVGKMHGALNREIKRRQLPIELLGECNRDDTFRFIARSKVLLHTSDFESFGMVVAEALMAHTHVVSTKVGIASELPHVDTYNSIEEAASMIESALIAEHKPNKSFELTADRTARSYFQIYSGSIE